jgi:hypothetical protein
MFCVLYRFKVIVSRTEEFKKAWTSMTKLFINNTNSLGSRLHKKSELEYIAYAQWPDEKTFNSASNKLPFETENIRNNMREACEEVEILMKLDSEIDMLKSKSI